MEDSALAAGWFISTGCFYVEKSVFYDIIESIELQEVP